MTEAAYRSKERHVLKVMQNGGPFVIQQQTVEHQWANSGPLAFCCQGNN